ncbi:MAG: LysR family transcriptional regulator [Lentisphaerae bacterium]|nr:MAG: LysR family transcriptional regulator [Lentisphaerota bacterium]
MDSDSTQFKANMKVWIYHPEREGVFGDGKVRLLRAIAQYGSLRAAAGNLKISYRKAWNDLKKAETVMACELVSRQRGGMDGGSMELSEKGRQLLELYDRFSHQLKEARQAALAQFKADWKKVNTP